MKSIIAVVGAKLQQETSPTVALKVLIQPSENMMDEPGLGKDNSRQLSCSPRVWGDEPSVSSPCEVSFLRSQRARGLIELA
jgi:hypothetical protein